MSLTQVPNNMMSRTGTAGQVLTSGGADADPSYQDSTATVFASSSENAAGTIENKAVDPLGIREAFNATGSAPVYACRAWVNFNGTGTVAIRASGNVTSITDNGTGDYTINFTTAMPDANYTVSGSMNTAIGGVCISPFMNNSGAEVLPSTSQFRFITNTTSGVLDSKYVSILVHR